MRVKPRKTPIAMPALPPVLRPSTPGDIADLSVGLAGGESASVVLAPPVVLVEIASVLDTVTDPTPVV